MEMLIFCVQTTYFRMESNISAGRRTIYGFGIISSDGKHIQYFEALESKPLKPIMQLRYINNTFIYSPHQEEVQVLLDHMNSVRSSIQLTTDKERNNQLAFLDEITTPREKEFKRYVYCKPTFTIS